MADGQLLSKERALLSLMERTSYNIIQENGQRKYGPPPNWHGPPPPKGCEVFVGKIPRDLYEDELVPVFERIGKIYEVRLMMDFSGSNRGYAFVMYTNVYDAKRAIRELDNFEIRKNRCIGVCKSIDNCRLFVGGIPKNKTKEEILREMRRVTDDVSDVILYSSFQDKTKNRGFAFVEYDNHRAAAMARRKLIPGKILLWGQEIAVDWAEPEPEVDELTMSKVTVLYVRNLSSSTSEEDLRNFFSLGNRLRVEKVKKLRDFAFIHYAAREDAEVALYQLNGFIEMSPTCTAGAHCDDSTIEVTWAKPADKSSKRKAHSSTSSPLYDRDSSFSLYNIPDLDSLCSSFSNLSTAGLSPSSLRMQTSTPVPRSPPSISCNRCSGMCSRTCTSNFNSATVDSCRYQTSVNAVQILDEFCRQHHLGEPCYYPLTFADDLSENRTSYAYKVVIPQLCGDKKFFVPDRLTATIDEAKIVAAEYILRELGLPTKVLSPWHSASALYAAYGSGAVGTHPKASSSSQVDLAQGDVGSLSFPGISSVCAALQAPVAKPHDVFDTSHFFELHGFEC